MPSYTILFMRRDVTDRRPLTLHISKQLFWAIIILAIGLPIFGFAISAGILAPAWLKIDVKNMKQSVEQAEKTLEPLQKKNESLSADKTKLSEQLKEEMQRRAEAEARVTMAETARVEASNRLAAMEGEMMNLKRSVATYERMFKPKLQRELVECVDQDVNYTGNKLAYELTFARVAKTLAVPPTLSVQVRVMSGNNAVAIEQANASSVVTTHVLDLSKTQHVKGTFTVTLPTDTSRLLDVKVLDGNTLVGYCWKSF